MPTQQDLQRRKVVSTGAQVQASLLASNGSAVDNILRDQANKTSTPGSHSLIVANQAAGNYLRAVNAKQVNFMPQAQVTGANGSGKSVTQSTLAQSASQALISAQHQLAQAQAQYANQQSHVNSLLQTSPNSPQLADAQAKLAAMAAQVQSFTQMLSKAQLAANANPTVTAMANGKNYTLRDILSKVKNKQSISVNELAFVIGHQGNALYAWMINNNPNNVNNTLKNVLGITTLPFAPDKKQMMAQINLMLMSQNSTALNTINSNFVFNPNAKNWTTNAQLVSYLKSYLHF